MIRPTLGYLLKTAAIALMVLTVLCGLFIMRLGEADALLRLNQTMGLYENWRGRAMHLEVQFPFEERDRISWSSQQLESFLAVKEELAPFIAKIRETYPSLFEEQTHNRLELQDGLLVRIVALRSYLLDSLRRHSMSISQYRYFEDLVETNVMSVPGRLPSADLTPVQTQILGSFAQRIKAGHTHGLELLGLPMP